MTIDDASAILGRIAGSKPRRFSTYDFGREKDPANLSALVEASEADEILEDLRSLLDHPSPFLVFIGTTLWHEDPELDLVEIVVAAHSETQFDTLKVARTQCGELNPEDLHQFLTTLDEEYGIDIFSAEADCLAFEFQNLPDSPAECTALAKQILDMTPDLNEEHTAETLVDSLVKDHVIGLSWSLQSESIPPPLGTRDV